MVFFTITRFSAKLAPFFLIQVILLCSEIRGATQEMEFIEDRLSAEQLKSDGVGKSVSKLKLLRKKVSLLGEKHPSRASLDLQIRTLEGDLNAILERGIAKPEVLLPKSDKVSASPSISELQVPSVAGQPTEKGVLDLNANENMIGSQAPTEIAIPEESDAELVKGSAGFELEPAFPWLEKTRLTSIGRFPRSSLVWGCENDLINSKCRIWKWVDSPRVVDRSLFWESDGEILDVAFSPSVDLCGLWFCAKSIREGEKDCFQLLRGQITGVANSGNVIHSITEIARGTLSGTQTVKLETRSGGRHGEFEVVVTLQGDGVIQHVDSSIKNIATSDSRLSFTVDAIQYMTGKSEILPDEQRTFHCSQKDLTVAIENNDPLIRSATVIRPFWRKMGSRPTLEPSWYRNIGKITLDLFYDAKLSTEDNGKRVANAIRNLKPGHRIRIHEGTYSIDGFFKLTANGTESAPITVEGAPGERVVITRPNDSENVINIWDAQFFVVRGIEIRGGGTGLKLYDASDFMLYDCRIYETGGNAVAANTKNISRVFVVDNEIFHTDREGEGVYFGSHNGGVVADHCFIIGNYIHDLAKGESAQGDGVEIKDGSHSNTVRANYIARTQFPGIITYRTNRPLEDRNIIEENVIVDTVDAAIQVTSDVIVRNNLVVTKSTAFLSKPFNTNPTSVTVVNNTFVAGESAVKVIKWLTSDCVIANNVLHSASRQYFHSGTGVAKVDSNVFLRELENGFCKVDWSGGELDPSPKAASGLIGRANRKMLPEYDLNGIERRGRADLGAVAYTPNLFSEAPVEGVRKQLLIRSAEPSQGSIVEAWSEEGRVSSPRTFEGVSFGPESDAIYCGKASYVLPECVLLKSGDGSVWAFPVDLESSPECVYRGREKVFDLSTDTAGDPLLLLEGGCYRVRRFPEADIARR